MEKLTLTIDRMRVLKTTLTERYDEFNHVQKTAWKLAKQHVNAKLANRLEIVTGMSTNYIDPQHLFLCIYGDVNVANEMLILDICDREEFNRRRIQFRMISHVPSIVHVPTENAIPGVIDTELVKNSLSKNTIDYHHLHLFNISKYHCWPYRIF